VFCGKLEIGAFGMLNKKILQAISFPKGRT
jgi:hypothetical protein